MNNSAKAFIAAIGFVFGLVVIVALIGWLAKGADFSLFKFFACGAGGPVGQFPGP
jgi:hypothetical protein